MENITDSRQPVKKLSRPTKRNIFLIGDIAKERVRIKEMLANTDGIDYFIYDSISLSEGIESINNNNIELVILDTIPGREGINAVDNIHNNFPHLPILVLSEKDEDDFGHKVLKKGAHDFLLKSELDKALFSHVVSHTIDIVSVKDEQLQLAFTKLRMSLNYTIEAISRMVVTKDPYTAGHQRRVADLARAIATEMKFSVKLIDGIRIGGSIHDIGKISIPAEILSKPSRLTDIEFDLIKTHTQIGYDILKDIEFSWPVADIVLQHHERINGTGYPNGLKGDDMIIEVKIMAVADVVEAMASHRPYRPSRGTKIALDEISKNKGILYDSDVASACIRVFKKGYAFR